MAGTVSQYQQTAFSTPVDGATATATIVLSNDNVLRGRHNAHDADATIHLQSSVLASRPSASVAGRVWLTTDGRRVYVDNGSAWAELAYLPLAGGTVTGTAAFADISAVNGLFTGTVRMSSGSDGMLRFRDFGAAGLGIDASTADEMLYTKLILAGTQIQLGGTLETGVIIGATDPGGSAFLRVNGTALINGAVTISGAGLALAGTLDFSALSGTANIRGATTAIAFKNNADNATNATLTDAGALSVLTQVAVGPTLASDFGTAFRARTNSTATGTVECARFEMHHTAAATGTKYAIDATTYADHSTGTVQTIKGVNATVSNTAAGTTTTAHAMEANLTIAAGVITNATLLTLLAPSVSGGSITNLVGLQIGNMASGGTTNFAITTGTGLVQFGDQLLTAPSTLTRSGFRFPAGVAPSAPIAGDMWYDGADYKGYTAGAVRTFTVT